MKIAALCLCGAALSPLAAQDWEAGFVLAGQSYPSITLMGIPPNPYWVLRVTPDDNLVVGLRLARTLKNLGYGVVRLTAGIQPRAETHIRSPNQGYYVTSAANMGYQHASLGAMIEFKTPVALGAGLEFRVERLDEGRLHTVYTRPWIRLNGGHDFSGSSIKPFLRFEVDFPLVAPHSPQWGPTSWDMRWLAPTCQLGLYGGVRF